MKLIKIASIEKGKSTQTIHVNLSHIVALYTRQGGYDVILSTVIPIALGNIIYVSKENGELIKEAFDKK